MPEETNVNASPASETQSNEASKDNYSEQFGASEPAERKLDLDKIKPLYEPLDLDSEEKTDDSSEEAKPEEPKEETPKYVEIKSDLDYKTEFEKIKSEHEEYKKSEEARFNQYYSNLENIRNQNKNLTAPVEQLFSDPEFVKSIEDAADGKDVAKTIMAKTVEITDRMMKTALKPVYDAVRQYQQEQVDSRVQKTFEEFKGKYGVEAEKCLQPGTPENKAIIAEIQQNPNLSLEKAFLLIKPNFVKQQIDQRVNEVIHNKKGMALPTSSGKTAAATTNKIETPRDAILATISEMKKKNQQEI